ncbi:MAG: VTT domain-containing protein [Dehalococcoidia bacterium]|jgi:membrane protein DedA with SNARE-associated domain
MFEWFQGIASTLTQWLQQGDPSVFGALFLISTVIEMAIPVPFVQDTVLFYVGYEPTGRLLHLAPLVMLALIAGKIFGGSIIYWVARLLSPRFVRWLGRRFPNILRRAQDLGTSMKKRSPMAVTMARLTPGLLTPSTVAAGLFQIRYLYFCLGVVISSVITDGAEIAAGLAVRTGFTFAGIAPSPALFIIALVIVMALFWLGSWLWGRRRTGSRGRTQRCSQGVINMEEQLKCLNCGFKYKMTTDAKKGLEERVCPKCKSNSVRRLPDKKE